MDDLQSSRSVIATKAPNSVGIFPVKILSSVGIKNRRLGMRYKKSHNQYALVVRPVNEPYSIGIMPEMEFT
jgi:hypothetical protein